MSILKILIHKIIFWFIAFFVLGVIGYANSFQGTFIFDDFPLIVENPKIQHIFPLENLIDNSRRPLVYLSLSLNYQLNGLNPFGYHLFNLIIHLLTALVFFGLLNQTLLTKNLRHKYLADAPWLSGIISLIWLVHPLQTQSVTYIIQRSESLMGLFYALTLYGAIRAYGETKGRLWMLLTILFCLLGTITKEAMVTAPIMVLLYDRFFIFDSIKQAFNKRKFLYSGLSLSWFLMIFFLIFTSTEESIPSAGLTFKEGQPFTYLLNQPRVMLHYLKISFWPVSLVFDYSWPLTTNLWQLIPALGLILVGLTGIVRLFKKYPEISFMGIWFFVILTPTSTLIPIKDLAVEHRLYLPLLGVIAFFILGGWNLSRNTPHIKIPLWGITFMIGALISVLTVLTVQRNKIYTSEIALWNDVVKKRPQNARAHNNLGRCLIEDEPRFDDGLLHLYRAIELNPDYADAHNNLGIALATQGQIKEATQEFTKAIELDPSHAQAFNNLGLTLGQLGQAHLAIELFQNAIKINPHQIDVYTNLCSAQIDVGRYPEAKENCSSALKIDPQNTKAKTLLNELNSRIAK